MQCPRCHVMNPSGRRACENCGRTLPNAEELSRTQTIEIPLCGLTVGSVVAGRYHILEELGSGGMGKVYKVVDQETRETLALKLLRPDLTRDERDIERFRNELKIAHQLSHRNICRMYHLGREGDCLFIVMEYVPGEDLRSFIQRSGQLSAGKASVLARQVCAGLGEAHLMGIVHRDLKPHNIMIDASGNAKIMDFGIARSSQEEGLTRPGYAVGTPAYMAPEQVEGKGVDQRSDIYALGVVLYEMVTGKPPFIGDTEFSVAYKHVHTKPAHPATLNPLIPEDMSRIILKCLEKDKQRRFQNAAELCAALDQMESRMAPTPGRLRLRTPDRSQRKGRWAVLSVAALFVAAVLLSIYVYRDRGQERSRGIPPAKPQAQGRWENSIAVLTVVDLSATPAPEYVGESLTDNIRTKLGSTGVLKVPSGRSSRRYAGRDIDPRDIGKELGVATILESTLQVQNDLLRVNVSIVRAQDGVSLWSNSYFERNANELLLEDEISRDVATQLGVEVTAADRARSKRKDPKDERDYDVFSLGRYFENRYNESNQEEDFKKAIENLRAYIDAHPDYALAYCSLGNVYEHRFALQNDPEDESLMRLYYEKAYQVDPDLEETNLGMGWAHFYRRDFDKSYDYFRSAVALGPDNPEVNWNVGSFLRSIGLDEKAIAYYEKSLVSDPLNSVTHWLCAASHMYIGQYEEGLSSIETAISLDREKADYLAMSARLLLLLNRTGEAEMRLEEGLKLQSGGAGNRVAIASVRALDSALHKDREKSLSLLREALTPDLTGTGDYNLDTTGVYALLGMKNEALQAIEEGIKRGFAEVKMELYSYPLLQSYPYFEKLRNLPEFKTIERNQKEIYKTRKEKYKGL